MTSLQNSRVLVRSAVHLDVHHVDRCIAVLLLQGEADKMVSPIEATRQWQNLFTGGKCPSLIHVLNRSRFLTLSAVPGGADLRVIVGGQLNLIAVILSLFL